MSVPPETRRPPALPRGRHAAPRQIVKRSHRERLLVAMGSAVADRGYGRVAVADVIERAGVSRRTFYEHFDNKEQCFLAAWEAGVDLLLGGIEEAVRAGAPDALAAATAGTLSYLETLAANPDFAQTFLIEVLAAGPEALERRAAVHERFAKQLAAIHGALRRDLGDVPALPPYVFRACVGAINELVIDHVERNGAERLPELLAPILRIELALILGYGVADEMLDD